MRFTLVLLFATLMAAVVADRVSVIEYDKLPSCARSCKVLETSELNCLPPAAPVSSQAIYKDCVCQSGYIRSLHASGEICRQVCNDEDDLMIYHYYNTLCGTAHVMPSSMSTTAAASSTSAAVSSTATAPPAPTDSHPEEPKAQANWLQKNGKYFAIAGAIILAVFILLIILAVRRRRTRKPDVENRKGKKRDRLIPLQLLSSSSTRPLRPQNDDDSPLPTPRLTRLPSERLRSAPIPSSLTPPTPSYSFSNSLRMYGEEVREEEARTGRRSDTSAPGTPVRSLAQTDRAIRDRIRATGRVGIPLRETRRELEQQSGE